MFLVCLQSFYSRSTAENTIGFIKRDKHNRKSDPEIESLTNKQKEIRIKISRCNDPTKVAEMKTSRNHIMHQIKNMICEKKEKELDKLIELRVLITLQ